LPDEQDGQVIALPTGVDLYAAWFGPSGHRLLRLSEGRWLDVLGLDERPVIESAWLVGGADGDGWVLQQPFGDTPSLWHVTASTLAGESIDADGTPTVVRDMALGPDGRMWAATDVGVVAGYSGAWTLVDGTAATSIAVGQEGRVWVAEENLVWSLEDRADGWMKVPGPDLPRCDVPGMAIVPGEMLVDAQGRLWLAGAGGWTPTPGLFRLDGSTWERMSPLAEKDPLASSLALAPNGDVWVTLDGSAETGTCWDGRRSSFDVQVDPSAVVARFDGRGWTTYGMGDGIPYHELAEKGLAITPDGTVWLSSGGGLFSFDGLTWAQHLGGQIITSVAAPADGSLLVFSSSGLLRITLSSATTPAPAQGSGMNTTAP
jgi:ligand-binding sensor domain-containing protein